MAGNGYVPWNTVLSPASSRVTVVVMPPSTLVAIAMGSAAIRCLGRFGIFGESKDKVLELFFFLVVAAAKTIREAMKYSSN